MTTKPTSRRFRKGVSGNPKGRPCAQKPTGGSAFDIVIDRTLTVTSGGVPREVTVEEALQHRTYQDAIAGDRAAQREILKMIAVRERRLAATRPRRSPKVDRRIEPHDPENAEAAMLLLQIAVIVNRDVPGDVGPALKLEAWAVQAALSRRRGGSELSQRETEDIERSTRSADALRWPRRRADG